MSSQILSRTADPVEPSRSSGRRIFSLPGSGGPRWQRWLVRGLLTLVALLAVLALLGYFVLPVVARGQIEKVLGAELGRPVTVGKVEFNPFTLDAVVRDFAIRDKDGTTPLLQFRELLVDVGWRSLRDLAPVLAELKLTEPKVALRRLADGKYNVQDLIDKYTGKPSSGGPTPRFSIANIVLDNGTVEFDDVPAHSKHTVSAIRIGVPFVSSLPVNQQVNVEPHVSATVDGSRFVAEGKTLPFAPTRPSNLRIDLDDFDLLRVVPYVPVPLPVDLKSARLKLGAAIEFSQPPDAVPKVKVTGDLKLSDVEATEKSGAPLLKLKSLAAEGLNLEPLESRFQLHRLALDTPQVAVQRRSGQQRFFEAVLSAMKPAAEPAKDDKTAGASASKPARPPVWKVDEITLDGGRVDFLDEQFHPKALRVEVDALTAKVEGLGSDPASKAQWQVSAHTAGEEALQANGNLRVEPLALDGDFKLDKVKLAPWWWVVAPTVALDATRGEVAADGHFGYEAPPSGEPVITLERLGLQLHDLALEQRWDRAPLVTLAALKVGGTQVDLAGHAVHVGNVESSGARLLVRRERDGRLNVQRLTDPASIAATPPPAEVAPAEGSATRGGRKGRAARVVPVARVEAPKPESSKAEAAKVEAGKVESGKVEAPKGHGAKPAAHGKPAEGGARGEAPWTVKLTRAVLDQYAVQVEDQSAGRVADLRLDPLRLVIDNLDTAQGAPRGRIELKSRVGTRGALSVSGPLGIAPLGGNLAIDARDIGLLPAQPYFTDLVNVRLSAGAASAKGALLFEVPPSAPVKVAFKGDAGITDFAALKKPENTDLLRWKTLQVKAIDFVAAPQHIDVGEVTLADFYSRLIISPDGRLNVQDLMVRKDAAGADGAKDPKDAGSAGGVPAAPGDSPGTASKTLPPPSSAPPPDMRVGRIVLTNGNIDFSDFFVKPNYSANLTGMNGSVSQISPRDIGDLDLKGKVDNLGTVDISGKLNPLGQQLFLDIVAHARDIDLPRMSPYSVKYIGYGIEKGKLSATVKYKLVDRQLTAENNVVLDQLTFGDKVDSPTALKLPVLFAVSLLKDRHGVIDVNMPISGSLDDPQFSIAGLVLRIIGNLIVKAVTSPFSLLASLGGSGEELSFVQFDAGRDVLGKSATEKLQSLAKALTDRPALKVDLTGRADPATDREALRKLALERQLVALKRRDQGRNSDTGATDADSELSGADRSKYLERAYRNAKFDRPRNAVGLLRDQPEADMERMLLEHIEVSDNDVSELATRRAQQAKDWLVETGKVDGERLFVLAPKLDAKEVKGAGPARVDLSLK